VQKRKRGAAAHVLEDARHVIRTALTNVVSWEAKALIVCPAANITLHKNIAAVARESMQLTLKETLEELQAHLEKKDALGAGIQAVPTLEHVKCADDKVSSCVRPAEYLLITFDGGMPGDAAGLQPERSLQVTASAGFALHLEVRVLVVWHDMFLCSQLTQMPNAGDQRAGSQRACREQRLLPPGCTRQQVPHHEGLGERRAQPAPLD